MAGSEEELLWYSLFSVEWAEQTVGLNALCECGSMSKTSCTWTRTAAAAILQLVGTIRNGGGGGCSAICILTYPVSRFPEPNIYKGPSWLTLEATPADRKQQQQWGGGGRVFLHCAPIALKLKPGASQKVLAEIHQAERGKGSLSLLTCLVSDELESALVKTLWLQRRHAAAASRGR